MAATVRGAVRELLEQTMTTIDALLVAPEGELACRRRTGVRRARISGR